MQPKSIDLEQRLEFPGIREQVERKDEEGVCK